MGRMHGLWTVRSFRPGNSIDPSVAVEFDTYQNYYQNDPMCDHIAYLENGVSRHETFWNGVDPTYNIEDDLLHDFRFRWDPSETIDQSFPGWRTLSRTRAGQ